MLRRGRIGRPGLIGTAARTAVIAGTASAVHGGISRRQQARADATAMQQQAAIDQEVDRRMMAGQAPPPAPPAAPPPPAPAASGDDMIGQLQRLADMKAQGMLSDAEFAAAKAKLIGA